MRGLSALEGVLEPARLHLAWHLLLRNERPTVEALRARGAMPSKLEVDALQRFDGTASEVVEIVTASDGARRLVVRLADGQHVESVVMGDGGVCVSTQVGCAVGCRFCASGIGGLVRNLSCEEILEQVAHARALDAGLQRVVYMGIGEPTHNLDAVLAAAEVLARDGDVHERSQTLSTVGSTHALAKLTAAATRPSLALSLHSADDALRRELLPHAPREKVADLVAAADAYGRATGREVQYAVALLSGVNDRDEDIDALSTLLAGRDGYLNVIPWNGVDGLPFARPSRERALAFVHALRERGVFTTLRWSAGEDADAACGQLRRSRRAI
ncbi:MAG: radical SAM protein [Planctomycetota bacterium]